MLSFIFHVESNDLDSALHVNTLTLKLTDGKEVLLDRHSTVAQIAKTENHYLWEWHDAYIWNGKDKDSSLCAKAFQGAEVLSVNFDDDAPERFWVRVVEFSAFDGEPIKGFSSEVDNDYIRRKDAFAILEESWVDGTEYQGNLFDSFENIPAADVRENVVSEWELTDYAYTNICKKCGYKHDRTSQYCPECGSYMKNGTKWFPDKDERSK